MAVAEQAIFEIVVKGDQAKRELGAIRSSADSLGGGLKGVAHGLDQIGGKAGNDARKAIGSLQFAMGSLSKETGQAINIVGDLAGALAGGPLVAAIAGVGIAIGYAADKYDIFGTKAAAAAKKASEHFADLKKEIADLDAALLAMATGTTIERIKQQAIVAEKDLLARQAIDAVGGGEKFARLAGYEERGLSIPRQIQTAYDAAIKATKEFAAENEKLTKIVRNAQFTQHMKDVEEAAREAEKAATSGVKKVSAEAAKRELVGSGLMGEGALKLSGLLGDAALDPHEDPSVLRAGLVADAKVEIEDASIQKRIDANKLYNATIDDLGQQALAQAEATAAMGVGVFGDYLAMKIQGEEMAEEKATAAFMKGIGSQLVGIGTRSLFEGGAKMFNPVTAPIGAAEMVFGGAAIAAGLGLGAGGTALAHSAAGGTVGKPLDKATSDRGVNSGRGRGAGGGSGDADGFVLNVTFAGAGPAPEQVGAATSQALATFHRRAGLGPTGASIRQGPRASR